ncbi:MAG: hypothetical protein V3T86_17180 [Planctomycetota bacterium]
MKRLLTLTIAAALLGACASRKALTMPEPVTLASAPKVVPAGHVMVPHLVAYPDSDVSCVTNAGRHCYVLKGTYYRFLGGNWFYATLLAGPWTFIEMKYVPEDIFRVHGQLPPGVDSIEERDLPGISEE